MYGRLASDNPNKVFLMIRMPNKLKSQQTCIHSYRIWNSVGRKYIDFH